MRYGDYFTQARDGSAEFLVIQGAPIKVEALAASGILSI
jgi:hypothetical protein